MSTPRISVAHLERFHDRIVRIVGTVSQLNGRQANLTDNGHNVVLNVGVDNHLDPSGPVEVVGKVKHGNHGNLELEVFNSTNLGPDFDLNAMTAVVDATHRFKEIFYD